MWPVNLVWVAIAHCLLFASSSAHPTYRGRYKASVFTDLTPPEMTSVQSFLMDQDILNLGSTEHTLKQNTIFMMELNMPKKLQVLSFLDQNGPKPLREAKVVIYFADQPHPNVTEYIVGPLPHPNYYRPNVYRGNKTIKFESRPVTTTEYYFIHLKMLEVMKEMNHILLETSGFSYYNCTNRCLSFIDIAPRGLKSGERRSWLMINKYVEGYFLHPIGIEILLNHRSLDPKDWAVEKIWYNGQYFDRVEELVRKYASNQLSKLRLPVHMDSDPYSTFIPRGEYMTKSNVHGPKVCEPQGKRYRVMGNYVEYAGWSFAFRSSTSAGMQLYDIQYNNERIAYEVSIQEAIAFYSGVTPAAMQTKSIDSGWGMGSDDYELAKGIDCPEVATYQDVHHFYDTNKPVRYKNAVCIFELPTGVPLRRHFDSNYRGAHNFYGGLENHVLVLRTSSTVDNYDYIWDFIFYQNGVIEVKVHPTGYIQTTFFTPNGAVYGSKVNNNVLGNLHTHLIHYKVDLDIAGTENSFETVGLKAENISNPWSPGDFIFQHRLEHHLKSTERHAAFRFGSPLPKYLTFMNPNKMNKWGHPKSYRIQYNSNGDQILPRRWKEEKGISWSRYSLAVTRHSNAEPTSSSIYAQNEPWDPLVYFENFIHNNEDIVNKDLVAWVTVGFLHIPHAEDIPNTTTPGNAVGFLLRPFNFFDEDPSVASKSPVIVRPADGSFSRVNIQRWTPEVVGHCVSDEPFSYNGTSGFLGTL
ncbi:amiloride-sensitive amine oxidase [copper-containing]-like [Xenopus laevis]|uniref:Amine oxidase n=1 Tax=Xenopus laevis TaxID=8355 RepID=A0A8J1KZM0_XENLA|nr:amiloride-sensitive amine oxidase [copper-containing]-like [Xenopus laevis]XP_041422743.1 amiloride-sensitive amine oxidase [copper-containing]-like [Xenopus laevis]